MTTKHLQKTPPDKSRTPPPRVLMPQLNKQAQPPPVLIPPRPGRTPPQPGRTPPHKGQTPWRPGRKPHPQRRERLQTSVLPGLSVWSARRLSQFPCSVGFLPEFPPLSVYIHTFQAKPPKQKKRKKNFPNPLLKIVTSPSARLKNFPPRGRHWAITSKQRKHSFARTSKPLMNWAFRLTV